MRPFRGFTLLEVMVSIAILAMAVTTLLIIRNDAIKSAGKAIEIRKQRILLEQKIGEIVSGLEKGNSGVFRNEGFPECFWRASLVDVSVKSSPDPEGKVHEVILKKVVVMVQNSSQPQFNQSIETYFFEKRSENVQKYE